MSADIVQYMTRDGDTVDLIAFSYYGKSDGTAEAILAANPGLADYEVLPPGLTITIPAMPAPNSVSLLSLWT